MQLSRNTLLLKKNPLEEPMFDSFFSLSAEVANIRVSLDQLQPNFFLFLVIYAQNSNKSITRVIYMLRVNLNF